MVSRNLQTYVGPAAFCAGLAISAASVSALPIGDQNGDGAVDVSDVQLEILLTLGAALPLSQDSNGNGVPDGCEEATAAGYVVLYTAGWEVTTECSVPAAPIAPTWDCADLNADGQINVSDVVLSVTMALGQPIGGGLDKDGDGQPRSWEDMQRLRRYQAFVAGQADAHAHAMGCDAGCLPEQLCCGGQCVGEPVDSPCGSVPCDDGVSCTVDYCHPELGCSSWPDSRLCDADSICDPEGSADATGCVPGPTTCGELDLTEPLGVVCTVAPPYSGAVWEPPTPGDTVDCDLHLAAGNLACSDPWLGCMLTSGGLRMSWTSGWALQGLLVNSCTWDGCIDWPIPFAEEGTFVAGKTPTGIQYSMIDAQSADDWWTAASESIGFQFPKYLVTSESAPRHAYIDGDGRIVGNSEIVTARLVVTEEAHQSSSLSLCVGDGNWSSEVPPGYLPNAQLTGKWPRPKTALGEDGLIVLSPANGWVCDDDELCTIDSFVPGVGCLFDVITPEDCDDGIWCTYDGCDKTSGECYNKVPSGNKQCPTWGDFCIPDSPFADPVTGCVDDVWSHVCWAGNELCTLSEVVHWDGAAYGPPEGDYLICPVSMARDSESCPNPKEAWCIPQGGQMRIGFDPSLLEVVGGYDTVCYEGAGCFLLPWFDSSGGYVLDSGHSYLGIPDLPNAGDFGWMNLVFLSYSVTSVLANAYVDDDGNVVGNAAIFDLWFRFDDGVQASTPTTVCADKDLFFNRYLHNFGLEYTGEGVIILHPPE